MKLKKYAKRVTSLFLALVMVISLFAGFGFETEAADYVQSSEEFADANGDGIINRLDPIRTRKNVAGSVTSNNQSDINGDGLVDALDIVLSKKMAAGELDEASFYSREITGDTYKFIFKRGTGVNGHINELTWDAEEEAYHYHIDGTVTNGQSDRNLWFDVAFVNKVIQYTGATSMSFKVKTGAEATGTDVIYYSNCTSAGGEWWGGTNQRNITPSTTYQTIEVVFSELLLDDNNNMKMPLLCYQHDDGESVDLYIADITFNVPEVEKEVVWEACTEKIYFNTTNVAFSNNTLTNLHNSVSTTYTADNKVYCKTAIDNASFYGRKFTLNTPITNVTSDMKLRMMVYIAGDSTTQANFRLYHVDYASDANAADNYIAQSITHGAWTEIEVELAKLVDSDGTFRGFQFGNFDSDTNNAYYFNWIEIWGAKPVIEWEVYGDRILFNETNVAYTDNTMTNLHNNVNTTYIADDKVYCDSTISSIYFGRKFTLNTPIKKVTSDMKLRMMVYIAGDSTTQANFRLYHVDYASDANTADNYIAQSITHGAWTEIEVELAKLVDSDGTFRGFQFGNFDSDTSNAYYFNWIEIWREKPEEVWEVHGKRDFNATDFTYSNVGITGLHDYVSVAQTTLDGRDAYSCGANDYALSGKYTYFGRTFTLNSPIAHVTSDMKLRMRVLLVGDGTETTDATFRLYNLSETTSANNADTYVEVSVPYSKTTIVEIDIANLLDSDGTFRGFKFTNFANSVNTKYYFNWIDIVKLQEEFDPVNYSLDFKEENVTVSAMDLDGINNMYAGTFTAEDSNNILSFANSTQYTFGGKKVTFKQSIENCTEDMLVTFRMKVTIPENKNTTVDSERVTIRLHIADAYGPQADNSYTDIVVPVVGEWTDVTCSLENLLVDGKFDGFFWSNFTNNYTISFDTLTVQQSDAILTNGVSTYQLLVPADSSSLIDTAATEFNTFFEEATGTELTVVSDDAVVEGKKYISIGETSLLAETGITYETSELGSDGFKIVTKGDNIYAIGGGDYGTLYAVYELLAELVNYEYFYKDTYNLDTGVKEIAFKELAITETPDIATRVASDGVVGGDAMSLYRMRVRPYYESLLPIGGQWFHNSFYFVNGIASEGTTNTVDETNWFNDAKTQLCYTAHGDEGAYEAMLEACLNTLKGRIKKQPDKKNVVFSIEDNSDTCTCAECTSLIDKYGAASATALLFLDDLQTKLDEWFATEDGKAYAGNFNIIFNAYKGYEAAPNSKLQLNNSISCLLSPIVADYYQPISADNATNATYYNTINDWGKFLNEGSLYVWYYGNNFRHYLAPYDSISNMQANYQLAVANNATYLFEQRQHDETGFVTGWSNLKSYLSSKLAWDATADVTTLTSNFFNAYFGETAATYMKNYYDELVELTSDNLEANNGFGGTKSVVQQDLCSSTYWPKETLETWLGYCDTALTSIADLQTSDSQLYNTYKAHIEGEKLAILYLYIETYLTYDNATDMASYISDAQTIAGNLGVTKYCEGGSISELFDKWGAVEEGIELVWTHGESTGISGVNNSGTLSYSDSVYTLSDCYTYSAHKLAFVEPQTYSGNETVSIEIKATPNTTGMDNLELILIPYDFTKTLSTFNIWIYGETVEVTTQGVWTTITFDIDKFLDDDGLFTGFGFVTSGYEEWSTGQMYTIEMEAPVVE